MVVSPLCLERGLSSTPSHHQCEGRPPAFQASRATRATNSAVASAACLEGPRGARYPICGCSGHPAFPTPSLGRKIHAQLGRIAPRECEVVFQLPTSLRGAQRRSNPTSFWCGNGLLRFARNDGWASEQPKRAFAVRTSLITNWS